MIKRLLKNIYYLYLTILINLIFINALPPYEVIINREVLRYINLQDQYAFTEHEILFENVSKQNVSVYKFEVEPNTQYYRFSAYADNSKDELTYYNITDQYKNNTIEYLQIKLLRPLQSGEIGKIYINFIDILPTKQIGLIPKTEYITRLYPGNKYFYSAYNTLTQNTLVQYFATDDENETEKFNRKYGPYNYVERYSFESINIEYMSFAMVAIQHYDREIDASSIFGKIKITETLEIVNKGPRLKIFNVDYESPDLNRFINWKIPKNSTEIKYYDNLGYVSFDQSWTKTDHDLISLELRLRYPLLGGWKTSLILSYVVPSDDYLLFDSNTNKFTLKMPIIKIEDSRCIVLSFLTRVILPSNSKILSANVFEKSKVHKVYKLLKHETIPALLFMSPRQVVKFIAKNLLMIDNTEFLISYYSDIGLWYVGWNFSCVLGIIFLTVIVSYHIFGDAM